MERNSELVVSLRSGRQGRGFTLIELLVVISIIALLIAMILPALGTAKKKASTVVCSTRIRGLGTATATYLAEYENTFPINGLEFPKSQIPTMYMSNPRFSSQDVPSEWAWRPEFGALWPIMGGQTPNMTVTSAAPLPTVNLPAIQDSLAKAYLCPDDVSSGLGRTGPSSNKPLLFQPAPGGLTTVVNGPGAPGYWSYSINAVLNSLGRFRNYFSTQGLALPWIDPIKGTAIANPGNFIMFVEEDQASLFNDEVFDAPALGGGDRITNRHNNGGNLGFGDNHVEWVSEVTFDLGGGNPAGTSVPVAMQSPWTSSFFPDPSAVPMGP